MSCLYVHARVCACMYVCVCGGCCRHMCGIEKHGLPLLAHDIEAHVAFEVDVGVVDHGAALDLCACCAAESEKHTASVCVCVCARECQCVLRVSVCACVRVRARVIRACSRVSAISHICTVLYLRNSGQKKGPP